MIHLFETCMITAFILRLTWSAPPRVQDQRYISIRSTDTIWLPGNIRAYQSRPNNGGNGERFGSFTITLQLKDKCGQALVAKKMETETFGDSNATRTTDASLETECVENIAAIEIIKATKESNSHRVSLSLSVFNPQSYRPLLITASGKDVNWSLKSVSRFNLCYSTWRRLFIYQERTDMPGYTEYVLVEGSFLYGQAVAVTATYRNVFIRDDPGVHFRRIIRNAEGQRCWHCRNSEPDAGKMLNTRLASDGPLR